MTDMVTRVAEALTGEVNGTCCHKTGGVNNDPKCECRRLARTAIETMREAGYLHRVYEAEVDAALKENEEKA